MKSLFLVCAVFLGAVSQCGAGVIVGNPVTPITVNVFDASYKGKDVGSTLINVANSWGKIGIFAMGYRENTGGSTYAGQVFLSVQSILDGSGNGIRAAFGGDFATKLAEGAVIDSSLNFQANHADKSHLSYYYYQRDSSNYVTHIRTGNFRSGTSGVAGYVGLELTNNCNTYYGWMHLTVSSPDSHTGAKIVIDNWAWNNTPDAPIEAGSTVPEPVTLALLGLGGMFLHRKK